jgi:hypothetical protein
VPADRRLVFAGIVALLGCADKPPVVPVAPSASSEPSPSQIVEAEPAATPPAADPAAARPLHDGRIVVSGDADPNWATGPALLVEPNGYHEKWLIERELHGTSTDLLRYAGMSLDLYGPGGRVCTAVIDKLTVEGHVAMEDVGGHEAHPDAETLWKALSSGETTHSVLLIGTFTSPPCEGAVWARDANLAAPVVLVPGDPDKHAALLVAEHRRVLASEPGKALAAKYAEYADDPDNYDPEFPEDNPSWARYSEGRREVWVDEQGTPRVVSINFGSHEFSPCHYQGPVYGVVRSLDGEGEDLFVGQIDHSPPPVAVFDADRDGRWELLIQRENGEFTAVYLQSENTRLDTSIDLPDGSWVWC